MIEIFRFQAAEIKNRKRLDEFLFERIGAVSKMHLRRLITQEKCLVNGKPENSGYHLKTGDKIEIEVDLSAETSMKPEPIPLEIIFEDEEIIVVNKPAEILVHPTRGVKSGTLLNALSFHFNSRESDDKDSRRFVRPGLVHRLDKQTSGLMVIAKTNQSHRFMADHFKRKLVEKKYYALVDGIVEKDSGEITAPIGCDEDLKLWRVMENGKKAETHFRVLERKNYSTLLELEPVTGRTNQLRAHCAFSGHPIVGDTQRGGKEFSRLCLHAYKLSFWHPIKNLRLEFETKIPVEFGFVVN